MRFAPIDYNPKINGIAVGGAACSGKNLWKIPDCNGFWGATAKGPSSFFWSFLKYDSKSLKTYVCLDYSIKID